MGKWVLSMIEIGNVLMRRGVICTAGLKFESGRASLVRVYDSWCFTLSPGPTKCVFWEVKFP